MSKEEFIILLKNAKEDDYGNLFVENVDIEGRLLKSGKDDEYDHIRWYFTLTKTVCDDFIKEYCSQDKKNNFEHYNRHFINDDTMEIKVINNGNPKKCEE